MTLICEQTINQDRELLVPVIGSLFDMPLPDDLQSEVCVLAREALHIVEEEDVPTITRTLLKTIEHSPRPNDAINDIRHQVH